MQVKKLKVSIENVGSADVEKTSIYTGYEDDVIIVVSVALKMRNVI